MGVFLRQDDKRSQLQERLAAELREKAKLQAGSAEPLDQSKQSNYLKDTDATSEKAWVWLVVAAVVVLAVIIFVVTR